MHVVGILGGIASGKSTVARLLQEHGARVLDVDKLAHEVLHEPDVKEKLRRRWGDGVFGDNGEVLRHKVAARVFQQNRQGEDDLQFLESVSHPRVAEKLKHLLEELRSQDVIVVLDAAVMLKAGWDKYCDTMLFVEANQEIRLARTESRQWSGRELLAREARQGRLEYKRGLADFVIHNGADIEQTQVQVARFWQTHINES